MGEPNFVVCRDCKYTAWLEDYELIEFVQEHGPHGVAIFPATAFEDLGSFEQVFRAFLGWSVKEEA